MKSFLVSRWPANLAMAGFVSFVFIDSGHDALTLSIGFVLGEIFAYGLLRKYIDD